MNVEDKNIGINYFMHHQKYEQRILVSIYICKTPYTFISLYIYNLHAAHPVQE